MEIPAAARINDLETIEAGGMFYRSLDLCFFAH